MRQLYLCALSNIKSGSCKEDCRFCTQSSKWKAKIDRYKWKSFHEIEEEMAEAKRWGATGFCLVTSGKGPDSEEVERLGEIIFGLKKSFPDLKLIGCFGVATREMLQFWKENGLEAYNHNLESSREFYPNLCTTHRWEERFACCEAVKSVGLQLYSGGIFGVGEKESDWHSLFSSLRLLQPEVIPINFFIPNPALPLHPTHSPEMGLKLIGLARSYFPEAVIMMAGGRELLFGKEWWRGIEAGANGIIIGNYLTTTGDSPASDWEVIEKRRYSVFGREGRRG
jgi:biotin synthase